MRILNVDDCHHEHWASINGHFEYKYIYIYIDEDEIGKIKKLKTCNFGLASILNYCNI